MHWAIKGLFFPLNAVRKSRVLFLGDVLCLAMWLTLVTILGIYRFADAKNEMHDIAWFSVSIVLPLLLIECGSRVVILATIPLHWFWAVTALVIINFIFSGYIAGIANKLMAIYDTVDVAHAPLMVKLSILCTVSILMTSVGRVVTSILFMIYQATPKFLKPRHTKKEDEE
jgi:hypothetical protein